VKYSVIYFVIKSVSVIGIGIAIGGSAMARKNYAEKNKIMTDSSRDTEEKETFVYIN